MRARSKPRAARALAICSAAILVCFLAVNPLLAGPWNITELFSNADGSVQFIELTCVNLDDQQDLDGGTIRSFITGKVYTIPTDLPSSATANRSFLIATDNFESLPGAVLPDYPTFPGLPVNFFDPFGPNGDAIEISHVTHGIMDTRAFFAGAVPTDGVHSLDLKLNAVTINTPTNFVGQVGSVNLAAHTGDYNGNGVVDAADYVVWRQNLNTTNAIPNDSTPESVSSVDYDVWRAAFGNGASGSGADAGSAVPEPTSLFGLFAVIAMGSVGRRRRKTT
jgi:serralysin